MSLSLFGVPDGQKKGQSARPCPSVYSPTTALGSLSSVALSSAPAPMTLTQSRKQDANYHRFCTHISSGFLAEATNAISSGFLREATGATTAGNQLLEFFVKSMDSGDCRQPTAYGFLPSKVLDCIIGRNKT